MFAIFSTTFPFFALVLCGYIATQRHWMPQEAISGLNSFILYFALPCLLFRFGAQTLMKDLMNWGVGLVYALAALTMVCLTLLLTRWLYCIHHQSLSWKDSALGTLVSTFPNTGFLGVPLLVSLLGESIAPIIIIAIAVDMVLTSSLCVALASLDEKNLSHGKIIVHAGLSVASNPMPWAILFGIAASALGLAVAPPIQTSLNLLADSASGVALFTIGAVIARTQMQGFANGNDTLPWYSYAPPTVVKLLLHPLLIYLLAQAGQSWGLGLTDFDVVVLTLIAALPSASNVSLLAEKLRANNGRIATIILATTALAFMSFSLIAHTLLEAS